MGEVSRDQAHRGPALMVLSFDRRGITKSSPQRQQLETAAISRGELALEAGEPTRACAPATAHSPGEPGCDASSPGPGPLLRDDWHRRWMMHDRQRTMIDDRLLLRLRGFKKSEARELADDVGAEATILSEQSLPVGGYGDVGTRTVAVIVTAGALRAVARYLAARQRSHEETVSLVVQIDDPDGTSHEATLAYTAAPGQSTVDAAMTALRALPGVSDAIERSLW